jgi:hypothetical protein
MHRRFFATLAIFMVWCLLVFPVFFGRLDPVAGLLALQLAIAVTLALVRRPTVHAALTVASWGLFLALVLRLGVWISSDS